MHGPSGGIRIQERITEESIVRNVDPAHIEHALSHIFDHAVRYTDSGSISMDIREKDAELMIRISDTGRGFDPAFVSSINEPIDTLSLVEFGLDKGSGLGLRVANGLIQESGGRLLISSEPGIGSGFTIMLPKKEASSNPDRSPQMRAVDPVYQEIPDSRTDLH